MTELFDLFPNVAEESVTGPASNHHYCVDWAFAEEHCHCSARSNGVRAYFVFGESKLVFAYCYHCSPEGTDQFCRGDVFHTPPTPHGRDFGVVGGARVASNPPDHCGPLSDWTQNGITRCKMCDCIVTFVLLLAFVCN